MTPGEPTLSLLFFGEADHTPDCRCDLGLITVRTVSRPGPPPVPRGDRLRRASTENSRKGCASPWGAWPLLLGSHLLPPGEGQVLKEADREGSRSETWRDPDDIIQTLQCHEPIAPFL